MQVWEACSDASITFESEDGEPLSFLVENDLTQMSLNAALDACPNVTVLHGAKVDKYSIPEACKEAVPDDKVCVHLSNGDVVETQLLVGADGNRYLLRGLNLYPLSFKVCPVPTLRDLSPSVEVNNYHWDPRFCHCLSTFLTYDSVK